MQHILQISVMKTDPTPNAERYEIETVEQIADLLTEENVEKFLADFAAGMRIHVAAKTYIQEIKRASTEIEGDIKIKKFTWIND